MQERELGFFVLINNLHLINNVKHEYLPGALLIALRGLRTLRTLRILRNPIPEPPNIDIRDTDTTMMSRQLKACQQNTFLILIFN